MVEIRTDRQRFVDGWTGFFERFTDVSREDILKISQRAADISMEESLGQTEFDARMGEIYREFGIEIKNNGKHLDQVF